MGELMRPNRDGFNVLNHGDLHFNNMLFTHKEDGETPEKVSVEKKLRKKTFFIKKISNVIFFKKNQQCHFFFKKKSAMSFKKMAMPFFV